MFGGTGPLGLATLLVAGLAVQCGVAAPHNSQRDLQPRVLLTPSPGLTKRQDFGDMPTSVGLLEIVYSDGNVMRSTATVLNTPGKNTVLTAAHSVYNDNLFVKNDTALGLPVRGTFKPGFIEGSAPYGTWELSKTFIDELYKTEYKTQDRNALHDQAVVVLKPNSQGNLVDVVGGNGLILNGFYDVPDTTMWGYQKNLNPKKCLDAATKQDDMNVSVLACAMDLHPASGGPLYEHLPRNAYNGMVWAVGSLFGAETVTASPIPLSFADLLKREDEA